MIETIKQLAEARDLFFFLCGAATLAALRLIVSGLVDAIVASRMRREVRPFDGWRGGRI